MNNSNKAENDRLFAAIKLIEQLYKDGKISDTIFRNILRENWNKIDNTSFRCYTTSNAIQN